MTLTERAFPSGGELRGLFLDLAGPDELDGRFGHVSCALVAERVGKFMGDVQFS